MKKKYLIIPTAILTANAAVLLLRHRSIELTDKALSQDEDESFGHEVDYAVENGIDFQIARVNDKNEFQPTGLVVKLVGDKDHPDVVHAYSHRKLSQDELRSLGNGKYRLVQILTPNQRVLTYFQNDTKNDLFMTVKPI